jgi:NAD dependent epimerase/dehydratase
MHERELGKIYVTGSDGFIGSHLVEKLINRGYDVTALCMYNSYGSFGWLESLVEKKLKNLKVVLGDIRDPYFLNESIKGHDTVFHLAALIAIPYSYAAPHSYFETNTLGTLNVMNACLNANISRFIHTSTSEVYGTAKFVPISENHPLQAQSPYSASKIAADMAVESFYRSMNLPSVILRPFNTFGPRQSMRAVIPTLISQILSGNKKISLGSLTPTRDFNYVLDTVNAFIAVAEAPNEKVLGGVFNTGTGKEVSIGDLVNLVIEIMNIEIIVIQEKERYRPEKSEVERLLSDPTHLKNATGWKAEYSLEDGLVKLIEWIKGQRSYLLRSDYYHT